ncbi:MAG: hypothetical protein O3B01_31090 [Planctomycetota bacterium]|nr:hypothetical protein [Planctomycetota bacterium]
MLKPKIPWWPMLILLSTLISGFDVHAAARLASLFSDGMVLQRDRRRR